MLSNIYLSVLTEISQCKLILKGEQKNIHTDDDESHPYSQYSYTWLIINNVVATIGVKY